MTYTQIAYLHLATVGPAFFIGTYLMLRHKGTSVHKALGRLYMVLMLFTAIVTLFMPAYGATRVIGHFGWIHLFSLLTIVSVPRAYLAIRSGDVKAHRGAMIGLYVGGILIAGSFAFMPGRMLNRWVASLF